MRQVLAGLALGLVAGGIAGFAIGASGRQNVSTAERRDVAAPPVGAPGAGPASGAEAAPVAASGAVPAVAEPARPGRNRVSPPPTPPPRRGSDAEAAAAAAAALAEPVPSADEILHDLAAALRSSQPLDGSHVALAGALAATSGAPAPDLALVDLALSRSERIGDAAHQIAFTLAGLLDPEVAYDALEQALAGSEPRRLEVAHNLAARAYGGSRDTNGLALALLGQSAASVRAAGVSLAGWSDRPPMDVLLSVAQGDADAIVRADAIDVLMGHVDWEDPADPWRAAATPLVLLAAREGRGEARITAIEWMFDIGAPAADTALDLLREGALADDLTWSVASVVLDAGRADELIAADSSPAVLAHVLEWIDEHEPQGEALRALFPALRAALRANVDNADSVVWTLRRAGEIAEVERIAGDHAVPPRLRAEALVPLLCSNVEGDRDEAARAGVRVLTALLDPATERAATRRAAVEALEDAEWLDGRARSDVLALLRRAAAGDPNSWVRDAAERSLEWATEDW